MDDHTNHTRTNDRPGEVHSDPKGAKRLERELGLGVKETSNPSPGMPAAQGGGLTSEIGTTPPETDPDR